VKRFLLVITMLAWNSLAVLAQDAQPSSRGKHWWASVATLVGSSLLDAHSSWNRLEANPLLQDPTGRFSSRGLALKLGIAGGLVATQYLLLRHNPRAERYATVLNFGVSAAFTAAAVRNYRLTQGAQPHASSSAPLPDYLKASSATR